MIRKKLFKILSLSLALSVASIGLAFAETTENLDAPVSIQITAVDEAMYEAQAEIDKLLFEKNYAKDLAEKGISITHTSTVDDFVEVGITPYTPENAEIVTKLLGKDNVKVIEGDMAVTLQYNPELNDENVDPRVVMAPEDLADDLQIVEITAEPYEAEDISTTADKDVVEDAKIISAPVEKEVEKNGISTFMILGLSAFVAFCGLVLFKRKRA